MRFLALCCIIASVLPCFGADDTRPGISRTGAGELPPVALVKLAGGSFSAADIEIHADARGIGADSITAFLKDYSDSVRMTLTLFDDGLHQDSALADGKFAVAATIGRLPVGTYLALAVHYASGSSVEWPHLVDGITTVGPLAVDSFKVGSDNLNQNGIVERGENIRYTVALRNGTPYDLAGISLQADPSAELKSAALGALSTGATASLVYDPLDAGTYLTFSVPDSFPASVLNLAFSISDSSHNTWRDSLAVAVAPFPRTTYRTLVSHVAGFAGNFEIRIVDPGALVGHTYLIDGVDSIDAAGTPGFTLRDSTDGRVLLENHPLPDPFAHSIPATDGFKIFPGTVTRSYGWDGWNQMSGNRVLAWEHAGGLNLEGFHSTIGTGAQNFVWASETTPDKLRNVLLRFAPTNTLGGFNPSHPHASFGYRYLRGASNTPQQPGFAPYILQPGDGYAFQIYEANMPIAAYNIETDPPTRLMVGFLENNAVDGRVDGRYWPADTTVDNTVVSGPREWFFVFDRPYSETADADLTVDILNTTVPLMWFGTPNRCGNIAFTGDEEFLLRAKRPPSSGDLWRFDPAIISSRTEERAPETFRLEQNFPNPFNPSTTIRYAIPARALVTAKVYDLLGEEVATLVDGPQEEGAHVLQWTGTNGRGRGLASGVYFLRVEMTPASGRAPSELRTQKLLLMK